MAGKSGYLRRRGNKYYANTTSDNVDVDGQTLTRVLDDIESMVKEKSNAIVFDSVEEMTQDLSDASNKGKYAVGTTVYIKDSKVSDKWIAEKLDNPDPDTGMYYALENMETENISVELVRLLRSGETQVVFDSDYIMNDVNLDVYTSKEGLDYISMDTSILNRVVVTYPEQESDVFVKLVIH